jgi:hypothetical protein
MCPQAARPRSSVVGAFLARATMPHGTLDVVSIRNMRLARESLKECTGQNSGLALSGSNGIDKAALGLHRSAVRGLQGLSRTPSPEMHSAMPGCRFHAAPSRAPMRGRPRVGRESSVQGRNQRERLPAALRQIHVRRLRWIREHNPVHSPCTSPADPLSQVCSGLLATIVNLPSLLRVGAEFRAGRDLRARHEGSATGLGTCPRRRRGRSQTVNA